MSLGKINLPNVPKSTDRDMVVFLQQLRKALVNLSAGGEENLSSGTIDFIKGINKRTNQELGAIIEDSLGVGNLLEILNGSITESQLFKDLGDRIDKIEVHGTAIENQQIQTEEIIAEIETIQSNVGENTASVRETKAAVDGINASWSIKADVNGVVGGLGIVNDGRSVDFIIRASTFAVAGPSGSRTTPFTVITTPMVLNGVPVPVGTYMTNAYIMEGSITSAKIGNAQVDTLQIKGEAVIIPRVQFTESVFNFHTIDTEEVINSITINAEGGGVSINFGFEGLTARSRGQEVSEQGGIIYLRIKRGNTVLRTMRMPKTADVYETRSIGGTGETYQQYLYSTWNITYRNFATILDVPPPGDQTYTVTLESRGLNPGLSSANSAPYPVSVTARSLHIIGAKR